MCSSRALSSASVLEMEGPRLLPPSNLFEVLERENTVAAEEGDRCLTGDACNRSSTPQGPKILLGILAAAWLEGLAPLLQSILVG